MTHTGLIEFILPDLKLTDCKNMEQNPSQQVLHPDKDSARCAEMDK